MNRRTLLTGGISLVVLIITASVILLVNARLGGDTTPEDLPPMTAAEADDMSRILASGRDTEVAEVIDSSVKDDYLAGSGDPLPAGSTIDVDESTFRPAELETASVEAVVSGPSPGRWLLSLHLDDGEWRILTTVPL